MLKANVFFVLSLDLKMFCSVYYQSQVHSKYYCLTVRLENIIPWRLLVTTMYSCYIGVIHLCENIFCFMAWLENILQFILSGKPVWRSGLKSVSHLPKKFCVICFIWKPFKSDEWCFLFHLKSFFCSQDI